MFGFSIGAWLRVGAVVAALGALALSHLWAYRAGGSAEQAAFAQWINQQNEDAGNAAEDWRARYRDCVERGGVFKYETSACDE